MSDTVRLATRPEPGQNSAVARNESTLLVNPLDPNHIVGVEEANLPDGRRVISARISFDGGNTWRESWPIAAEKDWAGVVGPVLAMDAHGTLHLAVLALDADGARASLVVYRSEDGGIHWTPPTLVMRGTAECCYSIATDLNSASVHRANVYVVADMSNTFCFARTKGGEEWKGAGRSRPGPMPLGMCFNPEVLVDARGAVHIVWMNGSTRCNILAVHSADGGETFCPPILVAEEIVGIQVGLPETAPATCITPNGVALCVWADDREGRSRIYGRRSVDGGRTWEGPPSGQPLAPDVETGQHEFQPHLIVTAGGEICCAFYEYGPKAPGGDLLVELAMAVSYDGGVTFTGRTVLSEQPWDPGVDRPISRSATRGALSWLALR